MLSSEAHLGISSIFLYIIQIKFLNGKLLLSLIHVIIEKILFFGQNFEMEILIEMKDLHIMKSPEWENRIFSVWSVPLLSA